MLDIALLAISALFLFPAAFWALCLFSINDKKYSWILIFAALFLMGIRRLIYLYYLIFTPDSTSPDLINEISLLVLSFFIFFGIMGIGSLHTGRMQAEERYHNLLDNMMEGYQIIGRDWRFLYVNDAVAGHGRKEKRELIGHTMMEAYPGIENTDAFAAIKNCMEEQIFRHMENEFYFPDGSKGWFDLSIQPVPDGVSVLSIDISERKKAEESLKQSGDFLNLIIEYTPNPTWISDKEGTVVRMNKALRDLLDVTDEEIIGKYNVLKDIQVGEQGLLPLVNRVFKDGKTVEFEIKYDTGKEQQIELQKRTFRILDIVIAPIINGQGNVINAIAQHKDITGRRMAENEIRKLNEELEQKVIERTASLVAANRELDAFSYSVSHDLRAPLRAIDGFSKVILDNYSAGLNADAQRYIKIVRSNTQQMSMLIDDLLSFSRLGKQEMKLSIIDMENTARGVFDQLRPANPDRPVNFIVQSPPPASGDPSMIRIVLSNFFSNAVKFTGSRKEAIIEFGGSKGNNENTYYIKDNGIGFDMKYVNKLFGVFQRLHSRDEYEGTGVGLALVQRIINRHGGRVWAEGRVNEGAVFYFTLRGKEE